VRLNASYAIAQHFHLDGDIWALAPESDHTIYVTDPQTIWQISRNGGAVKKIPRLGMNNCN
jgi:hypothetical protein